ncbi:helicase associated domain-containing protein [Streptomyces violascens]|uniref:Helicase-associated domain-containing protein n=1 Tax=Streptomyces violascens TaxID=67381 RepID=A0ABQ3QRM4_9ACTN|nr:helicase associated domain-containing protein [Streptomyces violascens]GGU48307.1 hypothetical protein GCM10010289_81030 [Streptomyces violascens]GHI39921.1 hypothetical protein Sviol_43290 [Streptomyces violascens]
MTPNPCPPHGRRVRARACTGVEAAVRPRRTAPDARAKSGPARGGEAFTRSLAALAQYAEREQRTLVPRQHTEHITLDGQHHDERLGVWVSNQKNRRDNLNAARLAELGLDWVQADRARVTWAADVR